MGSAEVPRSQFIGRISTLPVVTCMWSYASNIYDKAKESSPMLKMTLDTAEMTAKLAADRAMPVVTRFEKPLMLVDSLACHGLDQVEGKLPVITKSPQEIVDTTKCYGAQKMGVVKSKVTSVGNYGYTNAARLLDNKCGLLALDVVNWTLAMANTCVDYYLPAGEDEKGEQMDEEDKEDKENDVSAEPASTVEAKMNSSVDGVVKLSSKMHGRLCGNAISKMWNIQQCGQEAVRVFTNPSDLVQSAKTNLSTATVTVLDKASYIWEELNKEVEGEGKPNLETLAMNSARRFTRGMVIIGASARNPLQWMPVDLRSRMDAILQQMYKIYNEVWKAANIKDLISPEKLKDRMLGVKERLTYVSLFIVVWMTNYTCDAPPGKKTW